MADTFEERMRHLIDSTGAGTLRSTVVVDQVYARYQELEDTIAIREQGQHHYTRDALFGQETDMMRGYADKLVTPDGSDIRSAAIDTAERVSQQVYERAPLEFGDLKGSGHPSVEDNGATVYDRPPAVHRLSEDELRAKGDLRRLGLGNRITPGGARRLGIA